MKKFKIRRKRRETEGGAPHQRVGGVHRGVRRFRDGVEVEGPRAARAPQWPTDVAVPWATLLAFLAENSDRDLSVPRIVERLKLPGDSGPALREQIALLERERLVIHHRRGRITFRSRERVVAGRLSIPTSSRDAAPFRGAGGSFGFVSAPGSQEDLFIPGRDLVGAAHGDLVVARGTTSGREERTRGVIVAILERAPAIFTGQVEIRGGRAFVRPRDDRRAETMPLDIGREPPPSLDEDDDGEGIAAPPRGDASSGRVEPAAPKVKVVAGDLVVAEMFGGARPSARLISVFGSGDDSAAAEAMIIKEMGLPGDFPEEVERDAEKLAAPVTERDLAGREDFRALTTITIDPDDARDFDDAFSIEPLASGGVRLWVHIADVSHYVRPGSAVDVEAAARGTSIYFPGRVIPMLPHSLSSGICSLREGEDRLVQSVAIEYEKDEKVRRVRFASGVIRSAARLTYAEAAAAIEDPSHLSRRGEAGEKIAALIALAAPLAAKLTTARVVRGAIDLDLPEVEFKPGKSGGPPVIRLRPRAASNRMIEEFMLAANEAVARSLAEKGIPSIYRVHEVPDLSDIEKVEETLAGLGVGKKGGRSLAARLQHLISRYRGRPEEAIVARHVLRAMKLAIYSATRGDHFGLALKHYTHFTSPIRRYPDLIVHAILRRAGERGGDRSGKRGDDLFSIVRLGEIAESSSNLERRAEAAERALNDLLVARAMSGRVGEIFEGRVAGSAKTGFFVQFSGKDLPPGAAEGFIPDPNPTRFKLTEMVRVRLEEADTLRGKLRLALVAPK